jgi:exopolysaccharide production protein ExoZ
MLAHIKFPLDEIFGKLNLPSIVRGAGLACGVDIFFVLSGYVISLTASKGDVTPRAFLVRRFQRVVPVFWIASLPFLYRFISSGIEAGNLPVRTLWNSAFLLPVFDKFSINDPAHPFGWTLSFEIWFYVAFALLLAVAKGRAGILLPMFAIGLLPVSFLWPLNWKFPYFATHPFCLEFALGCIAFQMTEKRSIPRWVSSTVGIVGVATLYVAAHRFEYLGWHNTIRMVPADCLLRSCVWGIPAFCILIGLLSTETFLSDRLQCFVPLVVLGEASYAIYLVQPLVFEGITTASHFLSLPVFGPVLVSITILTSTIVAGLLFHLWIEKPLLSVLLKQKSTDLTLRRKALQDES